MTATPIQSEMVLWQTLRTRRRRFESRRGLDAAAYRWLQRGRHARRDLEFLRAEAEAVDALAPTYEAMSDTSLDERMLEVRGVFARRVQTPEQVRHGLAMIREAARREVGRTPYLVQLMGALGMFHGQIVEMATGEGKTLVAATAAVFLGWLRRPVHVITVNDYLAKRDAELHAPLFARCGLEAGAVIQETEHAERAATYMKPLVFTTQKELVADWLRDQLQLGRLTDPVAARWLLEERLGGAKPPFGSEPQGRRQAAGPVVLVPGLHTAIVDELDAVLIDEAVTPLIIAQPRQEDPQAELFKRACKLAGALHTDEHFTLELDRRRAKLTARGEALIERLLRKEAHGMWRAARRRREMIEQALVARHCYQEGQHYQIVEDQVMIVDEYTGRFMQDRQWQHGLHQAVEAKHELEVTADRDTLASMSFQRFFRQYPHLCGMTGTAIDARAELETTYGLPVRVIPTNRPSQRKRLPDRIYATMEAKWAAVVEEVASMHELGRPVLIGTRSIEASEALSERLTRHGLEHQVLNAVHHQEEAAIVATAGQTGAIMVATNMAGRGTDIVLGAGVPEKGGLHVILTERHTASRIDRQLFGRAGRQGDPGTARCIISVEDDLLVKFAPRAATVLRRTFARRTAPLPLWVRRVFDRAQRRAERRAFKQRAATVRHEDDLDRMLPG